MFFINIIEKVNSFLILRLGLGFVFFWFGLDKLLNVDNWLGYITPSLDKLIFIDINTFMFILGGVEIILGVLLIIGLFLRIVSVVIAIHLFFIIISIGFNDISVRNFGLLAIAVALSFNNDKFLSLDKVLGIKW